jgi:HTH-type transcriptional regulator / antitoxin HigA
MKTKKKKQISFTALPKDYEALCRFLLPRPIRDKTDYENLLEIAEAFAGFESQMTGDQNDYFDLITSLLETWENDHMKWARKTPLETLRHLLEDRAMTAADLSRILNSSPKLGPMILRGVRAITADHARKLGAFFGVPAGIFIE